MAKHDFGIIQRISNKRYDNYEPQKYDCISIHDDFIEPLLENLLGLNTFSHTLKVPYKGLVYWGITLIPPNSLEDFKIILTKNAKSNEYDTLISLIDKAIFEDKYIIHFGI